MHAAGGTGRGSAVPLTVLILLFVSVLVFAGTEVLPGDVAQAILGQGATPEIIANVRARLGLDQPAHLRYFTWLGNLLAGDLGTSLANNADMIGERILNTVLLVGGGTPRSRLPLAGVGLGLVCALKPNSAVDRVISSVSLTLISVSDCDEITSALDTVVAQAILDLLRDLQERLEVGYLFISHDISPVARVADTIAVMQNGRVVEYGPTGTVLRPPHHPYTELLLKSVPDMRTDWLDTLEPLGRGATGVP